MYKSLYPNTSETTKKHWLYLLNQKLHKGWKTYRIRETIMA